jgi:hypothetical protein
VSSCSSGAPRKRAISAAEVVHLLDAAPGDRQRLPTCQGSRSAKTFRWIQGELRPFSRSGQPFQTTAHLRIDGPRVSDGDRWLPTVRGPANASIVSATGAMGGFLDTTASALLWKSLSQRLPCRPKPSHNLGVSLSQGTDPISESIATDMTDGFSVIIND